MPKEIRLTEAEMKLMARLWDRHPQTMRELYEALEPETHWSKVTVCTLLSRMKEKGTVQVDESGAVKLYAPAVTRDAVAGEQTDALVRELYGGRASLLVSHLVERGGITEQEICELLTMLQKARH